MARSASVRHTDMGCPEPASSAVGRNRRDSALRVGARHARLHALRTSGPAGRRLVIEDSRGRVHHIELVRSQVCTRPVIRLRSGSAPSLPDTPAMAIGHRGNAMENANQPSEVPVSNWTLATGRGPASVTSIRLPTETRRVRPRQKGTVAEGRDSALCVGTRHARLHALPPILESGMPAVLKDSRDRARVASVLPSTRCRPRSGVGQVRHSVMLS